MPNKCKKCEERRRVRARRRARDEADEGDEGEEDASESDEGEGEFVRPKTTRCGARCVLEVFLLAALAYVLFCDYFEDIFDSDFHLNRSLYIGDMH